VSDNTLYQSLKSFVWSQRLDWTTSAEIDDNIEDFLWRIECHFITEETLRHVYTPHRTSHVNLSKQSEVLPLSFSLSRSFPSPPLSLMIDLLLSLLVSWVVEYSPRVCAYAYVLLAKQ
jgi:hypothetical protein